MYYEDIFQTLIKAEIKFLVVGAMALNFYGIPRMTSDLDLMIELSTKNSNHFIEAMKRLNYRPRVPVQMEEFIDESKRDYWFKEKNMLAFTLYNPEKPYQEVAVFIRNPVDFDRAYERRITVKAAGLDIPVISIDDMIKMKKISPRKQDLSDIEMLEKLKKIK